MRRTTFSSWPCSVARTIDLLGDWWTPLVLRQCFYGTRRFDDFQRQLQISRNVLTQRLRRLEEAGLLERVPYQDRPLRHEYVLTSMGKDFFPVIAAIAAWGDRWMPWPGAPSVELQHTSCGQRAGAHVVCCHCGQPLRVDDVCVVASER